VSKDVVSAERAADHYDRGLTAPSLQAHGYQFSRELERLNALEDVERRFAAHIVADGLESLDWVRRTCSAAKQLATKQPHACWPVYYELIIERALASAKARRGHAVNAHRA